jgi:hypothetical protein
MVHGTELLQGEPMQPRLRTNRFGKTRIAVLWTAILMMAAACHDLLTVRTPDVVRPTDLTSAAGLAALRAGAFGDFAKAYGGDATASDAQETQILATGMLGDEYKNTDTDPERIAYDARRSDPKGASGHLSNFYTVLQRARQSAEATAAAYITAAPTNVDQVVAEMTNLAGFTYVFLAEDYCSGVPISSVSASGDIQYGQPETTQQLLTTAANRFDTAIVRAQKAKSTSLEQLARVGKARALVNLGQFAQAAAAVTGVPTSFRYTLAFSTNTPRQENAVFYAVNLLQRWSVANKKGGNGIDYQDAFTSGDPRTPFVVNPNNTGFDKTAGTQYMQLLYPSLSAAIPVATGAEARLVEAEAALNATDLTSFQTIHNQLRATLNTAKVGPISTDTMTAAQVVSFHFRERALWMYSTGHRLGDLRRLIRQYGRTQDQVFPSGPYYRSLYPTFGTDVNFPVAFAETNNPNFTGCLDRNP